MRASNLWIRTNNQKFLINQIRRMSSLEKALFWMTCSKPSSSKNFFHWSPERTTKFFVFFLFGVQNQIHFPIVSDIFKFQTVRYKKRKRHWDSSARKMRFNSYYFVWYSWVFTQVSHYWRCETNGFDFILSDEIDAATLHNCIWVNSKKCE